jgi:hypothetical protein
VCVLMCVWWWVGGVAKSGGRAQVPMADWFEEAAPGDGRTTPEWLRNAEQHLRDKPVPPNERTGASSSSNNAPMEVDALPLETVRGAVRRLMLSAGEVIDGSSDEAFELLVALELILGHGFKRRSTLLAALGPGGPERLQPGLSPEPS